jgi:hypothetical protein
METPQQAESRRINNAKNKASWRSSSEKIRETIMKVTGDPNNRSEAQISIYMNSAIRQMFALAVTDSCVAQKK